MANSSITTQERVFTLSNENVNGPLNLVETILSAQTSEPEWVRDDKVFVDVEKFNKTPVKYRIMQSGSVDDFSIVVRFLAENYDEDLGTAVKQHVVSTLGLSDQIELFYRSFDKPAEPLSMSFPKLRGLRLMRGTNYYESLICSILSQNNSVLLWNRTARLLMRYYGERVKFPDGSLAFLFPKADALAGVSARGLQSKTSMGYRAKPVVQVSRMVTKGELNLNDLQHMNYARAMEVLLELPGVGPKVADCFLLYGMGKLEAAPVDVWIHRIVSKLYFKRKKVSKLKTARFLRERFGAWAGYAQLYLFDYARRMGIGAPDH